MSKIKAQKIIFVFFIFSLTFIVVYEFILIHIYQGNQTFVDLGVIISRVTYSIVASSIFYCISIYIPITIPKKRRKIIILENVARKTNLINEIVCDLMSEIKIENKNLNYEDLENVLKSIDPESNVSIYENWYFYLFDFKQKVLDTIRSIVFYNEFLDNDYFHELILIENQLLSSYTFDGYPKLAVKNLEFSSLILHNIIIHNNILQDLNSKISLKYDKEFIVLRTEYRKLNFKD